MGRYKPFGDSVSAGKGTAGYTVGPGASYYPDIVAMMAGKRLLNLAVGGMMAADACDVVYANPLEADDSTSLFFGVNDSRQYGTDANKLACYKSILAALTYFLGQNCISAQTCPSAGTWSPSGYYYASTTPGSRINFTFNGDVLTFGYGQQRSPGVYAGEFKVTSDGVDMGHFSFGPPADFTTFDGRTYATMLGRIAGCGTGCHAGAIEVVSGSVYLNWIGQSIKPNPIYLLTTYLMNFYGPNGSDAAVAALNAQVAAVAAQAAADGLNVTCLDTGSTIDRTVDLLAVNPLGQPDGLHPTQQGNANLASAFFGKPL